MSNIITTPDAVTWEKLFKDDLTCRVTYGLETCGKPAQYKIIMACCGGSDFMCAECYHASSTFVPPAFLTAKQVDPMLGQDNYFGCGLCHVMHKTWKAAVKEVVKI